MNEVVVLDSRTIVVSNRDVLIVELYSNGVSTVDIAAQLGVSPRTIEAAVARMKIRFNCNSLIHLVSDFLRKGLIK
jgi:DNA-binding NarL/FixJ family response regulator